jgi:hypothetical protein
VHDLLPFTLHLHTNDNTYNYNYNYNYNHTSTPPITPHHIRAIHLNTPPTTIANTSTTSTTSTTLTAMRLTSATANALLRDPRDGGAPIPTARPPLSMMKAMRGGPESRDGG